MGAGAAALAKALQGAFTDTTGVGVTSNSVMLEALNIRTKTFSVVLTDGGTAATDVTETLLGVAPFDAMIVQCQVLCSTAITAAAASKNFNFFQRLVASPSTQNAVAVFATTSGDTGNIAQWASVTAQTIGAATGVARLTAANLQVTAGSALTASMTHNSTGVATNTVLYAITLAEIV